MKNQNSKKKMSERLKTNLDNHPKNCRCVFCKRKRRRLFKESRMNKDKPTPPKTKHDKDCRCSKCEVHLRPQCFRDKIVEK